MTTHVVNWANVGAEVQWSSPGSRRQLADGDACQVGVELPSIIQTPATRGEIASVALRLQLVVSCQSKPPLRATECLTNHIFVVGKLRPML